MFARRAGWDLSPNELAERVARRRAAGARILDLTESNPTRCGLEVAGAALRAALAEVARDPRSAVYAPDPRGDRTAREAVAAHHARQGAAVSPDDVVLTAGTSEGYAHLFRLLADPGERVLVPSPSYPLFGFLAGLESVDVEPYPLRLHDGRWRIDQDAVEAAAPAPTRAILLVHPNNPTGSLVGSDEARALRRLCRAQDLALVCDEVFSDYRSDLASSDALRTLLPAPTEQEAGPVTFVLSGASKLLGLPQLKVGWIVVAGPRHGKEQAVARLEVIADTYLSVSGPAQLALPLVMASHESIHAEIARRVEENRARVAAGVQSCDGVTLLPAEGGWSAILRVGAWGGRGAPDEDALVHALLDDSGVIVQPGWLFDLEPRDELGAAVAHLVLSLLPEPAVFAAGLACVLAAARDASR
jgi:hypothetical protein